MSVLVYTGKGTAAPSLFSYPLILAPGGHSAADVPLGTVFVQYGLYLCVQRPVAQGQTLGTMGTTGTSTGIHLHLEVHVNGVQTNPRSVINGTETV